MYKRFSLILILIFSYAIFADDPVSPQSPTQPATNQPATTQMVQTSPNITITPSNKDLETADKLFKDTTYDNFQPQPEQPFIDSANLNNPD